MHSARSSRPPASRPRPPAPCCRSRRRRGRCPTRLRHRRPRQRARAQRRHDLPRRRLHPDRPADRRRHRARPGNRPARAAVPRGARHGLRDRARRRRRLLHRRALHDVGGLPRKNLAHVLASRRRRPDASRRTSTTTSSRSRSTTGACTSAATSCTSATSSAAGSRRSTRRPASSSAPSTPAPTRASRTSRSPASRMFVNGRFTGIAGHSRSGIAVLRHARRRARPELRRRAQRPGRRRPRARHRFYIGGTFTEVSGRSRAGLAAFDIATGNLDPALQPVDERQRLPPLDRRHAAVRRRPLHRDLARFNNAVASLDPITGEASQAFRLFLDKDAYTLAMLGSKLYIGGEFTKVNEQPRNSSPRSTS